MFYLRGKTALVMGADSGIPGACSELLHRSGANLILTDLNEEGIQAGRSDLILRTGG